MAFTQCTQLPEIMLFPVYTVRISGGSRIFRQGHSDQSRRGHQCTVGATQLARRRGKMRFLESL
jgi:hypothetical protein